MAKTLVGTSDHSDDPMFWLRLAVAGLGVYVVTRKVLRGQRVAPPEVLAGLSGLTFLWNQFGQ